MSYVLNYLIRADCSSVPLGNVIGQSSAIWFCVFVLVHVFLCRYCVCSVFLPILSIKADTKKEDNFHSAMMAQGMDVSSVSNSDFSYFSTDLLCSFQQLLCCLFYNPSSTSTLKVIVCFQYGLERILFKKYFPQRLFIQWKFFF